MVPAGQSNTAGRVTLPFFTRHLVCVSTSGPAMAQGLEEVVVTAERRAGNLQSTPIAVSAFTSDQLDKRQATETLELADNVPNLVLYTGVSNPGMVNLYMRGAGEQIGGLVTSESAVGLYVDDVYNARLSAANFDLVNIERIEVLRGPQGTLYGRNSMTGAIKVVTREADGEAWSKVAVGYGSFNEHTVRAGGGFSLIDDVLAATLSAQYRDQDEGWLYNRALNERRGVREVTSFRTKLSYLGSETFKATLSAYYSDDVNDGLTAVATNSDTLEVQTGDWHTVQSPSHSAGLTEQFTATLDLEWDLGGASLRSISSYIEIDDEFRFDLSGGVEVAPDTFVALIDRSSVASSWQFSQELQLNGSAMNDKLDYIVGAYAFMEQSDQQIDDVIFSVALVPTIIDQESEFTWLPTERLEIFGHLTLQNESYQKLDPGSVAATQGRGRLSHLSDEQYQLGGNYDWPLGSAGSLALGGNFSHRSPYFSDAANQPINDSGTINLLDASISYRPVSESWKLTLAGSNLTDEEYSKIGLVLAQPNGIRFVNLPPTWQLLFELDF